MSQDKSTTYKKLGWLGVVILIAIGILARFYRITQNEFFFFDEGLYLNLHRHYLELIDNLKPRSFHDIFGAFYLCVRLALGEGKPLWFLISHLRVFFGGLEMWYFPRVVSAIAGSLTLIAVFIFAKNFFQSKKIGWLSAVILAILPSHVFYSRLGLQEALCTFIFLMGIYYYIVHRAFGVRTFISGALLGIAFFLNYRLVVLPLIIFFYEAVSSFLQDEKLNFRKYLWHTVTFFSIVFFIGNIDQAQNTVVTFAWMFYQARLGQERFDILNLASYPYYLFRLEGVFVGLLFFGNVYLLLKKEWKRSIPFLLVCFYMAIFSFAGDKGARYLCVMLPFVAMAMASLIEFLFREYTVKPYKIILVCISLATVFTLLWRTIEIARLRNDYQDAVEFIKHLNPHPLIVTSQPHIINLYTDPKHVMACPRDFETFTRLYHSGFRYVIIDPQAYVSRTLNQKKFEPRLLNYLNFIKHSITPVRTFPHFNDVMLERFVFEHNENLRQSVAFLRQSKEEHFGNLQIFDMKECIEAIAHRVQKRKEQKAAEW